jgi:hypothetical protein
MIASCVHHNTTLVPQMVLNLLTGKKVLPSQEEVYSIGLTRCNHNGFPIVSYKVIILCDLYQCHFLPLFQSAVSGGGPPILIQCIPVNIRLQLNTFQEGA